MVDAADGSDVAKQRALVVLKIVAGELSADDAAAALGVTRQRLHQLRRDAIAGLVQACEHRPAGRPRRAVEPQPAETTLPPRALLNEIARVRTELDLAFGERRRSKKNG